MSGKKSRVCLIGAGPSGLSLLCWRSKMIRDGRQNVPEIVCYEKQEDWGGLWNFSWRTGTDEFGELVHGSMYRNLWSNGPKECLELPHYTFDEHFGKSIPSFPPREVLFDYLQGRWRKDNIKSLVKFNTIVKDVVYNEDADNFTVMVKDLAKDELLDKEVFDYVVVASGHFSTPNVSVFDGIEKFPGRVLHSHDFRDAREFSDATLLIIGASLSAEDIALQCVKFGAKNVVCSWRTKPMGFKWPQNIEERPLVQRFEGRRAWFKDGTSLDVDTVIFCTGYLHSYPFLRDNLRLKSANVLYPENLYKGIVWTKGGNEKVFYLGAQDQAYTFTMFDICGLWLMKHLMGDIQLPDKISMTQDGKDWVQRNQEVTNLHQVVDFQTEYVMDLVKDCGEDFPYDINVRDILHEHVKCRDEDISTYRDYSYTSKYTGTKATKPSISFMKNKDDSFESFMNQSNEEKKFQNTVFVVTAILEKQIVDITNNVDVEQSKRIH